MNSIWSDEKVTVLRRLAKEGKSNKEIATELELPIAKIYAKRSQLGITIDKVAAAKSNGNEEIQDKVSRNIEYRRKKEFIRKLRGTVIACGRNVESLELSSSGNFVTIRFTGGSVKRVNIEADSFKAIVLDVVGAIG